MERSEQHWEYLALTAVVELNDDRLNQRGAEGWELVSAVPLRSGQLYYVFKRPSATATRNGRHEPVAATPAALR